MTADAGNVADMFVEWVYSNPGKAPEDYAGELERVLTAHIAAAIKQEREACATLVHRYLGADGYGVAQAIREGVHASEPPPKE